MRSTSQAKTEMILTCFIGTSGKKVDSKGRSEGYYKTIYKERVSHRGAAPEGQKTWLSAKGLRAKQRIID